MPFLRFVYVVFVDCWATQLKRLHHRYMSGYNGTAGEDASVNENYSLYDSEVFATLGRPTVQEVLRVEGLGHRRRT